MTGVVVSTVSGEFCERLNHWNLANTNEMDVVWIFLCLIRFSSSCTVLSCLSLLIIINELVQQRELKCTNLARLLTSDIKKCGGCHSNKGACAIQGL